MTGIVLLTGGTGFVGRQVLAQLLAQSIPVRVITRSKTKYLMSLDDQLESIILTEDLFAENQTWWEKTCRGIDTIIHVAWYAEPGKYLNSVKNLDCMIGTLVLARACASVGVRRFVGVGTCFEYDLAEGRLSVDTPLKPTTPYAAAKASVFSSLSEYFSTVGIEFVWCRLFYLYGEGEDSRRLVPYLRSKLEKGEPAELTSGNQIRDFIDVTEAGALIVKVALGSYIGAVNVCSGVGITAKDLAESIADEYGRRDLLRFGARPDNLIDPPCVVGIIEKSVM